VSEIVDLRTDTLTMPTPEMRRAMAEAEVGDDVFGEDPTVNRLEHVAAERVGKDAAMLISSGTMGNLLGVLTSASPGDEVIADADAHVFIYEVAGAAALGGVQIRPLVTDAGVMDTEALLALVRPDDVHQPRTAAVTVEDTHNRHGGVVWPLDQLRAVSSTAHERGLRVHLDGARVFNAATAQNVDVREIAACADTVTFCLSKGLGAPAGSLFCGPAETVKEARRWRKMLGGGMRQAGVLAAAGLVALERMVERLADDHRNARTLAEGMAELPGLDVDLDRVQTNIVRFRAPGIGPQRFLAQCRSRGLLGSFITGSNMRFVTRHGIQPDDVQRALTVLAEILRSA
jgi:threonine aldolase